MAKAKESAQIHKARQKIQEQLIAAEKRTSPQALENMAKIIEKQLARRKPERITLKGRQITLFDENQHPAKTESKFVLKLLNQIKHETFVKKAPLPHEHH